MKYASVISSIHLIFVLITNFVLQIVALHLGMSAGGAEFYPSCTQVRIGGTGNGVPDASQEVSFPGGYTDTEPGILVPDVSISHFSPVPRASYSSAPIPYRSTSRTRPTCSLGLQCLILSLLIAALAQAL